MVPGEPSLENAISVAGSYLCPEDSVCYLGHVLTNDTRATAQAQSTTNGLYRMFFGSRDLLKCCSVDLRRKLFLSYCSSLYGLTCFDFRLSDMQLMAVAWRRCLKMLYYLPQRSHTVWTAPRWASQARWGPCAGDLAPRPCQGRSAIGFPTLFRQTQQRRAQAVPQCRRLSRQRVVYYAIAHRR